jgi:glycosyltransferase involved in cell wall biosynthesis
MRLAWIVPRYGPQIMGGAETQARAIVEHLARRHHHLEVWTTCAQSAYTWANDLPAGVGQHHGVTVRRFPVQVKQPVNLWVEPLTLPNQYLWVNGLAHSPQLYGHIADHGDEFDGMVFMPYLAGTTYHGARIEPGKSVVWTCLHDELPAYLAPTHETLSSAAGLVLNSRHEQAFLNNTLRIRHPRTAVVGMGFDLPPGEEVVFRNKYPNVAERFFVYAGRLEQGKNIDQMLQYYLRYRARRGPGLDLLLLGEGPLGKENYPGVTRMGFADETTKRNALAACTFLCQPSRAESFSIVLMEAWAQGKPVLVNARCPVTLEHVRQAQGGLWFADYGDFEASIDYLLAHLEQAAQMGMSGRRYVQKNYDPEVVISSLEQALASWLSGT